MTTALHRTAMGRWGEDLAARYLADEGLHILDRNWRCADGELDIVAREGAVLVFCEVKTRSSGWFGDPAEAVIASKAGRIRRLAVQWLGAHPESHAAELRFDVVAVLRPPEGRPQVRHLRAAF